MADAVGTTDTTGGSAAAADLKEDDELESKETALLRYFLQEWEVVKAILDRIVDDGGVRNPSDIHKIRSILDKYQEQGELLEPYLECIVSPLMSIIRSKAIQLDSTSDGALEGIKPLCIIIYTLVNVCGYKSIVRFFPHQVSDLEPAVTLLEKCHQTSSSTSLRQESTGEMETKCIVLLWLYILVLIPFDISTVDTSISQGKQLGFETPPLVTRMLEISKDDLSSAGPMRRMSGLLLARLLTRPDMSIAFSSFAEWAHVVLSSATEDIADHFRLLGAAEALASIFKVGSRKVLENVVPTVWNDIFLLIKSTIAVRSPLLRKLLVKLAQRVGLICLPHRSPLWHYLGKSSLLGENLLSNDAGNAFTGNDNQDAACFSNTQLTNCLETQDIVVPEVVEEILELLLCGLRDSDTVVRWSAAKGIGRITACLTFSLAEEVLSSVLELFSSGEGDGSWHGGCLALAELARRGLLLPVSLPKVVNVIIKALHYDVRRGPHSIGSHVRDAASYVCWAFGRAYSNTDMRGILELLAPHLLTVACYDREVNCRRAASAAFQENVGRQGIFPHGIEIVNTADYFSLASRQNSYLRVAVSIAQHKEYLYPFAEELLCSKVNHWDKSLRELAAEGLASLAKYDCEYFAGHILNKLIRCTLSLDLPTRHGATLAAGEVVLALHHYGYVFPIEKQKSLSNIVPAIEKARLYRGKGGEIMRSAVSRFIQCICLSDISLSERIKKTLHDTLNENLKHPNAQIQVAAVNALKHFVPYFVSLTGKFGEIVSKYLELLDDQNVAARRGAALALGIFPHEFLTPKWKNIAAKLCSSCTLKDKPDDPDAEARVNAVQGLVSVCETLSNAWKDCKSEEESSFYIFVKNDVMQTLFEALEDYAVDNRGDVGSWVREAAMNALERCTYILCRRSSVISKMPVSVENQSDLHSSNLVTLDYVCPLFDEKLATNLIGGIAKQAVEKIDKIREIAAKTLQRILHNENYFVPCILHREILECIIPSDAGLEWGDPAISYPRFVQLLELSCYSQFVLSGLVISIGGLQESLRKASVTALLGYLQGKESGGNERSRIFKLSNDFLWILKQFQKSDRIIIPTLKTIEILFSKKVFQNMEEEYLKFCNAVANFLVTELKGSKDFTKLRSGISIFGYIASDAETVNVYSFTQLLSFLGHRYPKIRKTAADQVYLVLLQNGNAIANDKMEEAMEVLSETCWEAALEDAKRGQQHLYELTGLDSGSSNKTSTEESRKKADIKAADENSSYASLVGFSGF